MPRSDGVRLRRIDELTRVDLEASRALAAWEWAPEVVLVKVRPCEWQDCGGSVLLWSGEAQCLLCCRSPGAAPTLAPPNGYGPRNGSGTL